MEVFKGRGQSTKGHAFVVGCSRSGWWLDLVGLKDFPDTVALGSEVLLDWHFWCFLPPLMPEGLSDVGCLPLGDIFVVPGQNLLLARARNSWCMLIAQVTDRIFRGTPWHRWLERA